MLNCQHAQLKTGSLVASFLFALLLLSSCGAQREEILLQGGTMGTTYSIKYVVTDHINKDALAARIGNVLGYLDSTMSTYQSQSELNRLNDAAVGEAVPVSAELWQVLLIAERIFRISDGAFDPTVGPLVDLWGFGPLDTQNKIPTEFEIDVLRLTIGFQHLRFLPSRQSVEKQSNIRIDLSAIAKGYAAERVAELLSDLGVDDYLVEIGGELRAGGLNAAGKAWRVAIEEPVPGGGGIQRVISILDKGVATSGDYRNFFEQDGTRYSHTIDPRTGRPVTHNLVSVTVITKDATEADALATAYLVLGAKYALAMANRDSVAALLIVKNESGVKELSSEAFADYINSP